MNVMYLLSIRGVVLLLLFGIISQVAALPSVFVTPLICKEECKDGRECIDEKCRRVISNENWMYQERQNLKKLLTTKWIIMQMPQSFNVIKNVFEFG